MANVMTPDEMRELLATLLEGAAGQSRNHSRKALEPVEKLPTHSHVRCNLRVPRTANKRDLNAIKHAIELVRAEHPYVAS